MVVVAPDGGWSWMVLFAGLGAMICTEGMADAVSVLVPAWLDKFQSSRGSTAWIGSLLCLRFIAGPFGGVLIKKFGCRKVGMLGSLMMSAGIALSAFGTNVPYMYFTYGILGGTGCGLPLLAAIVSVGQYFDKKRHIAYGISVAGVGVGISLFSMFQQFLLDEFGWFGTALIMGAVLLNNCVFCAIFRPLPDIPEETENNVITEKAVEEAMNLKQEKARLIDTPDTGGDGLLHVPITAEYRELRSSKSNLMAFKALSNAMYLSHESLVSGRSRPNSAATSRYHSRGPSRVQSMHSLASCRLNSRVDINVVQEPHEDAPRAKKTWLQKIRHLGTTILETLEWDPSLLTSPIVLVFLVANLLKSFGNFVPLVVYADKATTEGLTYDQATLTVSMMGFAGIVGRLFFPAVCSFCKVRSLWVFMVAVVVTGVPLLLLLVWRSFTAYCFCGGLFGAGLGGAAAVVPALTVDLFGVEELPTLYGFEMLMEGATGLIAGPIAGALYDVSGTYDWGFGLAGIALIVGGLMLFAIPCLERKTDVPVIELEDIDGYTPKLVTIPEAEPEVVEAQLTSV
ncbi:monocarboxylate transporter 9-like [Branchiostoma floridae]|uniref:Monocarboxylate transporter 9-like n=1 Tax=Branchiostoma floridae TaxID=7739 RepID=A0A9J7LQT0_BRAFL|nr:monocarboxylate transporter 9-like [Branchiostoma floridae]XP_035686958.1 monocarboxylate transporter 9-like [Branchiostoma floridae]